MVILINGISVKYENLLKNVIENEYIEKSAKKFLAKKSVLFSENSPTINVFQGEFIFVDGKDCISKLLSSNSTASEELSQIRFIGSPEATTCLIVGLKSRKTGNCFLGHFDGRTPNAMNGFLDKYFLKDDSLNVHMCGSYVEDSGCSIKIINQFLDLFFKEKKRNFHIETSVIDKLNTAFHPKKKILMPLSTNMCLDIFTGECFPSVYDNMVKQLSKLPLYDARRVRVCNGDGKMFEIKFNNGVLSITPFQFQSMDHKNILLYEMLDDKTLLQYCSTSPDVEADDFVDLLRAGWTFQKKNQDWTKYFENKNDVKFKFISNKWVKI